jgi:hypothetical protein
MAAREERQGKQARMSTIAAKQWAQNAVVESEKGHK